MRRKHSIVVRDSPTKQSAAVLDVVVAVITFVLVFVLDDGIGCWLLQRYRKILNTLTKFKLSFVF